MVATTTTRTTVHKIISLGIDIGMRKDNRKEEKNRKIYGVINTMSEQKHAQNAVKIKWRCQKLRSEMFCFCFSNNNEKRSECSQSGSSALLLVRSRYSFVSFICPFFSPTYFRIPY